MAWMSDEAYDFIEDCKEKKDIGRSARNKRGHCGKGGRVIFSSDNLTKKQRESLNGECKVYRMNAPMKWGDFVAMPVDLQIEYIKSLRKKFNVPDFEIASMLDVSIDILYEHYTEIKLRVNVPATYDTEGWLEWRGEET